jgi:hypothetical protein
MSARYNFTAMGGHFRTSAPDGLLLMAISAYWPGEPLVPGKREHVDMILARATAAGFGKADIFVTMLSNRELSKHTIQLAEEVTAAVGGDAAMIALINDFQPEGAAQ